MKKMTAVNIERIKPINPSEEIYYVLYDAASRALNYGMTKTEISQILSEAYNDVKVDRVVIPVDLPTEEEFREKAEKFFEIQKAAYIPEVIYARYNDDELMRGYDLNFCNYHVEVICAAHKLLLTRSKMNENTIFNLAKDCMEIGPDFIEPKTMLWPRLTARKQYVSALRMYYDYVTRQFFKDDKKLESACNRLMRKYNLSKYETDMFRMIFVINNFDC